MRSVLLSSRVRLAVLLCALGALGAFALVPGGGSSSALGVHWCRQPTGPPSLVLTSARLRALGREAGATAIVHRGPGAPPVAGVVGPITAWRDQTPDAGTPFGGGYEIRRAMPRSAELLADVFPFPSAADAAFYVARAGRSACRPDARSRALAHPRGARTVTWVAPGGRWETDVLLARGPLAIRVAMTSAPGSPAIPAAVVVARVCALRRVHC